STAEPASGFPKPVADATESIRSALFMLCSSYPIIGVSRQAIAPKKPIGTNPLTVDSWASESSCYTNWKIGVNRKLRCINAIPAIPNLRNDLKDIS
ncbi:MAG: hypothetical protein ABGY05_06765, partial [Pseudomonadota bacterium]